MSRFDSSPWLALLRLEVLCISVLYQRSELPIYLLSSKSLQRALYILLV
jgi:hypothetical protein